MIVRTRSIVLNYFRYGETDLIVNLYTEELGRQTIFVKGAHNKKSAVRSVLFQPLYLVETEIHHRSNRQMQRISSIQVCQILQGIPFDPVKSSIAFFIAEILGKTLKEEEANPDLFNFLYQAIQTLDLNERGTANFHLLFLIHYTRYLGFYPHSEDSPDNLWIDLRQNHMMVFPLLPSYMEFNQLLSRLYHTGFERLGDIHLDHHQRNELTEFILSYYSKHVDDFGKVKSFPILRNVFQD